MAYAYVVKSSEDGILGVFGKLKRAQECAKEYTKSEVPEEVYHSEYTGYFMWVYEGEYATVEVNKFELE